MKRNERRKRRNKNLQAQAFKQVKKHEKEMKGKLTVLIPHPTIPKTMIEKIVD
jgi:hypothetical protein